MAETSEPMKLLLGLILFLAIAASLYFFFGNPTCDSLANATASNLRISMNKVADPDFPAWSGLDEIPGDSRYYESAFVRLCQDPPGKNEYDDLFMTLGAFYGGVPQYQVYYEQFPEMQPFPLIWNEAYPWSGGSFGTVAFWGGIRFLSLTGKVVKPIFGFKIFALGKVISYSKNLAQKGGRAVLNSVKKLGTEAEYAEALAKAKPFIEKEWGKAAAESISYSRILNFRAMQDSLAAFEQEGFLIRSLDDEANIVMDNTGRLVVTTEEVPVKISFADKSGQQLEKYLFVKRDALGKVEEMRLLDGTARSKHNGFELATVKPSDLLKEARKLNPKDGEFLDSLFVSADEAIDPNTGKKIADLTDAELEKFFASSKNSITKAKFFRNYFKPVINRFEKTVQKFKTAGYDVDKTFMKPDDTKAFGRSLNTFLQESENYENFVKPSIGIIEGAKARIMKAFGLTSPQQINRQFTSRYITEVMNNIDGVAFVPRDSKLAIYRQAMETYPTFSKTEGIREFPTLADQIIHNMKQDPEYAKLLKDGTIQESEVRRMANNMEETYGKLPVKPDFDTPQYKEFVYDIYFKNEINLAVDATEAQQKALGKEINLLTGFMDQNTKATTITSPAVVAGREVLVSESRKIIYLHGTALINPVSFYARGLAVSELTEGCEYNSLCVYSHATQLENPFFLSSEADKFTVRSWRPVNPLYYIGIQAALMHVPPHPTFYLTGPCIGQAKIWKVKSYEGNPTIFVSVDKFENDIASNYCYADIDLVNAYTAIWDASDAATIITAVFSGGGTVAAKAGSLSSKAATTVSGKAKWAVNNADPITLAQAAAEALISWPGSPWKVLGFEEMRDIAAEEGIETGG